MNTAGSLIFHAFKRNCLEIGHVRNYAFKSDLKIKWVRPEKIPSHFPQKSGDLVPYPKINTKDTFLLDFQKSKELETADENVKKLFTLEFSPQKYTNRVYFHDTIEKVKRHSHDVASAEVLIARWTGVIRALQLSMERFPRNTRVKVRLNELIDKRKKRLKFLRKWDYKRFEWLLETLDIVYKPAPSEFIRITRKESLTKLTNIYCDNIKQERLSALRLKLESEQPAFLEEKIRTLEFIRDEQKECGVEVTVTQEEIDSVRAKLKELQDRTKQDEE